MQGALLENLRSFRNGRVFEVSKSQHTHTDRQTDIIFFPLFYALYVRTYGGEGKKVRNESSENEEPQPAGLAWLSLSPALLPFLLFLLWIETSSVFHPRKSHFHSGSSDQEGRGKEEKERWKNSGAKRRRREEDKEWGISKTRTATDAKGGEEWPPEIVLFSEQWNGRNPN